MSKNKLLLSNEEGSIAILVAFLLTIFIGFMGLAVDFGYAYLQKTRLQKVADAEALACVISPASAPCPANGTNLYPELNPYGFTVTTVNPGDNSLCLNPAKQSKCARATAQVSWNTFFINLFGVNTLTLSAKAVGSKNWGSAFLYRNDSQL
jgi:Flp pilus assembly protein TadG